MKDKGELASKIIIGTFSVVCVIIALVDVLASYPITKKIVELSSQDDMLGAFGWAILIFILWIVALSMVFFGAITTRYLFEDNNSSSNDITE